MSTDSDFAVPPGYAIWPSSIVLVNGYSTFTSCFLLLFVIVRFVLEPLLPRLWGKVWDVQSLAERRSFTIHHMWLGVKGGCVTGIVPLVNVVLRSRPVSEAIIPGSALSNADFLSVLFMLITSAFAMEIAYRVKISPVSLIHHMSAIVLASWQLAGELNADPLTSTSIQPSLSQIRENETQFRLIMLYGSFEIVFESWMHVCCILYRKWKGNPRRCALLWGSGGLYVLFGSLFELGCMIYFWHRFWPDWGTEYRVVMPILHVAFMAAQLHGARIGLKLRSRFLREAREQAAGVVEVDEKAETPSSIAKLDIKDPIDVVPALVSTAPTSPISPIEGLSTQSIWSKLTARR